jgi:hypothetical protein
MMNQHTDQRATKNIQQLSRTAQAEALHDAVREKDLTKLETLLRAGVDPLIRTGTILLAAVASRFGDGVCLMLQYVKELPQSSPKLVRRQETLLQACLATACDDPECDLTTVRALIGKTSLTHCSYKDELYSALGDWRIGDVFKLCELRSAGVDLDKPFLTHNSFKDELSAAIRSGRLDVVIELHRAGADIRFIGRNPPPKKPVSDSYFDPLQDRPLLLAIKANRQDIVEYLIQHGAKLENVEKEVTEQVRFVPSWDTELSPKMVEYLTERGMKLQDAQQQRQRMEENRRRWQESDPNYAANLAKEAEERRMVENFPYKLSDGSGATIDEQVSADALIEYIDVSERRQGSCDCHRLIKALEILEEQGDLTAEVCDTVLRRYLTSSFYTDFWGKRVVLHLASKGAAVVDITRGIEKWFLFGEQLPVYQTLYELGADISRIIEGYLENRYMLTKGPNYSHTLRHFQLNRDSYMENCSPLLREVLSCSGPSAIDRGAQLASRIALITADWPRSDSRGPAGDAHSYVRQLLTNELQALDKTAREGDRGKLEQEIDELLRDAVDLGENQVRQALSRIMKDVAPFTRVEVMGGGGSSTARPRPESQWERLYPRLVATRGLRGLIDLIELMNDPKTLPPLEYVPYSVLSPSRYNWWPKQWEPLFEGEIQLGDNYEARCIRSDLELGWSLQNVSGIDREPWYVSITQDGKRCGYLKVKLETRSEGASSAVRRLVIERPSRKGDEHALKLDDLCKELERKAQAGEITFNKRIDCIVGIPESVQRDTMSWRELQTGVPDDEPELLVRYCEHYLKLEQQLGCRLLDDVSFEEILAEQSRVQR